MTNKKRIERELRRTLQEVAQIQCLIHRVDGKDRLVNLFNARSQREDAVRGLIIHLATAMESVLDDLYRRVFLGYRPGSRNPKRPRGKLARELDELLETGKLTFDAKLRFARIGGLITRSQYKKLDKLRALRNKCAHNWSLDVIKKRERKPRPSRRLLEHNGRNLFEVSALEKLLAEYGPIYLSMFGRLLASKA
jgi:hypothetical protein